MSDQGDIFLTNYLVGLLERTRAEKRGMKIGFDWVIYNLALAKNWKPVRLPFYRTSLGTITKTEPEYGIDLSFTRSRDKELVIFVLKDEELNNQNWKRHDFDSDIRMAASPDLSSSEFKNIRKVSIILAYNKDEDKTGVTLFNNLSQNLPSKIQHNIECRFERWNLTKLVREVKKHLLTPHLVPQSLSSALQYLCLQIADFDFGTPEWENQLVPQWKYFLSSILTKPIDKRRLNLIPVVLLIIYHHKKNASNTDPGWIDLIEWAMLALWNCAPHTSMKNRAVITTIWIKFYLFELQKYFLTMDHIFKTEHGFGRGRGLFGLSTIEDSYLVYWHIGRLGILTYAPQEVVDTTNEEVQKVLLENIQRNANLLQACIQTNPAILRPLIDLHHIETFLIWMIFLLAGHKKRIYFWLSNLEHYLFTRRIGRLSITVPFIESRNRLDLVAEYAATGKRPFEFTDDSSYFLLMVLELCFSLDSDQREELINRYYNHIILGVDEDGKSLVDLHIDLLSWAPPEDWGQRILNEEVKNGIAIATMNFKKYPNDTNKDQPISERIKEFIEESRSRFTTSFPQEVPRAALILGCIKNSSPLPPEFWRSVLFN